MSARWQAESGSAAKIDGIFRGSACLTFPANAGALHIWLHLQFSRQDKEEVRSKTCKSGCFPRNFWMRESLQKELLLLQ